MTHAEIFQRLLDETAAIIAHPGALALPSDELHTEILLPLLPAMLRDRAIREAWRGQGTRGFFTRMAACREADAAAPRWEAGDFEIHVAASYLAGPDAKALADTLLSEESLRDLTAALLNTILDIVWPMLPPPDAPAPVVEIPAPAAEVPAPAEIPATPPPEPVSAAVEEPAFAPSPPRFVPSITPARVVIVRPSRIPPLRPAVVRWVIAGAAVPRSPVAGSAFRPALR